MVSAELTRSEVARSNAGRARARTVDLWLCLALAIGALFWAITARPLRDPDVWWHVRTGDLIRDSGIPQREPWAFTAIDRRWVPTAWLTDVLLSTLHSTFGWIGIIGYKMVLAGVLLALLGRLIFRTAHAAPAALVFSLCVLVLTLFMAERPQLISLIFCVYLAAQAVRVTNRGSLSWWLVPITYLWANFHGMWVLAPMCSFVLALGCLLDRGGMWRAQVRRCGLISAACIAVAALTPVGPRLAYWALVVRGAARDISEWQPTVLSNKEGLAYLSVFLLWAVASSQFGGRVPLSENAWMIFALVFGVQAGRNIAPTVILMAPFAARALTRTYASQLKHFTGRHIPRVIPIGIIGSAIVLAGFVHTYNGSIAEGHPFTIVEELKSRPESVRVLNDYNIGGFLTGTAAPQISVAIDGRTDNYDPSFVHRYLVATQRLDGLEPLIAELDPDVAVTAANGPLARALTGLGWRKTLVDEGWGLLEPPQTNQ